LNLAVPTLGSRLRDRAIQPDAILVHTGKADGQLFDCERLPALRQALISTQPEIQS